ncbi:MAG: GIY-YIG nuclease family protein [Candidatus Aenigmarchaeota archaeon]|nr:GIY-YIG nuclease family protein [Candidatus Aenigmarchaeota archaeon]
MKINIIKNEPFLNLKLPCFELMEKVMVRLNKPRMIKFKDGRKVNLSQKTIIPLELKKYKERKGVYIICKNNQVEYVGATTDFEMRMKSHAYLKKHPDITHTYFLEEENKSKRLLLEMIYKYHYFGKVNVEWNYAK